MLSIEQVKEVEYLLKNTDMSMRKIAEIMGLNKYTVRNIAKGKHKLQKSGKIIRNNNNTQNEEEDDDEQYIVIPPDRNRKARCPKCRALVYMPCVACQVRDIMKENRAKNLI